MMHNNRYRDQQRYDVAIGEPLVKPPPEYDKVAGLRRVSPYNVPLRLFRPMFKRVAVTVLDHTGTAITNTLLLSARQ
jgi:hypothetical protein